MKDDQHNMKSGPTPHRGLLEMLLYHADGLDNKARQEFELHLLSCARCRELNQNIFAIVTEEEKSANLSDEDLDSLFQRSVPFVRQLISREIGREKERRKKPLSRRRETR